MCVFNRLHRTGVMSSNFLSFWPVQNREVNLFFILKAFRWQLLKQTTKLMTRGNFSWSKQIQWYKSSYNIRRCGNGRTWLHKSNSPRRFFLQCYWQVWETFVAIPKLCESWFGIFELLPNQIHQCLFYPQFKVIMSNASKESDYPLKNCTTPGFYSSLFLVPKRG